MDYKNKNLGGSRELFTLPKKCAVKICGLKKGYIRLRTFFQAIIQIFLHMNQQNLFNI